MILYWVLMILLALISIKTQLNDRTLNLEAYAYKRNSHAQFENYRSMRERITRLGGHRENNEYPSDYSAQRLDQDDEDEDQQLMANHRNR